MTITRSPEELLEGAPTDPAVDLVADLLRDPDISRAEAVLTLLAGTDDKPGAFDRYLVNASILDNGNPLVSWYCPKCHHVGAILHDVDGGQANLTLGEFVQAVLEHEREEHR